MTSKLSRYCKRVSLLGLSLVIASMMAACEKTVVAPAAEVIVVKDAYIRAMPPGQKVTAMFMVLDNGSPYPHRLVKVESEISSAVELHEHSHENGVMKMGQVEFIVLKPNGSTALAPAGYHVMLIGLKKQLKLGDKVEMKLIFEDASSQQIEPEVKAIKTH